MRYDQMDIALGFLEDNSSIVLQVPYARDIQLVNEYLVKKLRPVLIEWSKDWVALTNNRKIYIDTISHYSTGYGVGPGKCFFIDRLNDRSYMDRLEVVGCV